MKRKSRVTGLTEFESHVLALIWRHQPTTAYQVRHAHAHSPTLDFALSQGSVYPVIERLKTRGFVDAVAVKDGRRTEQLSCTTEGEGAVKAWLSDFPARLPDDPLRSRILALSILAKDERAGWVRSAKECLLEDLAHVEEFAEANPGPLLDLAHDNARSTLLARIRWLERVEGKLETVD
jgi:DNA-binding PadR family transcriptional regulator